MRDVSYTADGVTVRDNVTSLELVCSAHPSLPFPHGPGCAGPGAPPEYRRQVLYEALRDIRIAAAFGDAAAARWLTERGIDHLPGDDTPEPCQTCKGEGEVGRCIVNDTWCYGDCGGLVPCPACDGGAA